MLKTLKTGLEVLRLVALREYEFQSSDIADVLKISQGKAYSLLRTLISEGMIERLPNGALRLGPYAIGFREGLLLASAGDALLDPRTLLAQAHDAIRETVYMTLLIDERVVIVAIIEATSGLRVGGLKEGFGDLPHVRAAARAIMAHLDDDRWMSMVGPEPFERVTDRTVTTIAQLRGVLADTRERGFALEVEEYQEGVSCVAAALVSPSGDPIGSISVSGPSARILDRSDEIGEILLGILRGSGVSGGDEPEL